MAGQNPSPGQNDKFPSAPPTLYHAEPYVVEQLYDSYTDEQHARWASLVGRRRRQIEHFACQTYLDGYQAVGLEADRLPSLTRISQRLHPLTGWSTVPVSGFLPAPAFFEMLAARQFPSTTWLREPHMLEYTPEPDIFHDVFGHVPMHAHRLFADFLQHYGLLCARTADPESLEMLGRLFWYTVEFGLIREKNQIKMFGSGIISSHGESTSVIEGKCEIAAFDVDRVLTTPVKVDAIHQVLFAIDSFDQMYDALLHAERRLQRGSS